MKQNRMHRIAAPLICTWLLAPSSALSNQAFPSAQDSDPAKMAWMVGSPPPPDRQIRFDDGSYFRFPQMRWSVANFRQ